MDTQLKLVCVGDGCVGKTSLLITYSVGTFPEEYVPTVFDNYETSILHENVQHSLVLWDTAGQESYDRLRPLSYPLTNVFIICFQYNNTPSFRNVFEKWIPEITQYCPNVPYIIVATKTDLPHSLSPTYLRQRQDYIASTGITDYVECSAKTNTNVHTVFTTAMNIALQHKEGMFSDSPKNSCCSIL